MNLEDLNKFAEIGYALNEQDDAVQAHEAFGRWVSDIAQWLQ